MGHRAGGGTRADGSVNDPLAGIQPDWSKARYSQLLGAEVVEIPFEGLEVAIRVTADSTEMDSYEAPPANTAIKLIAGLDSYGQIYYKVLYITVSDDYVAQHPDFIASLLQISDLDENFSGLVQYCDIDGSQGGGFWVVDGEVVHLSSPQQESSNSAPQKIKVAHCTSNFVISWLRVECDVSDANGGDYSNGGIPIDAVGICEKKVTNEITNCTDIDISIGGGGGGPSGGGGPGSVGENSDDDKNPPTPPEKEPADPCKNMQNKLGNQKFTGMLDKLSGTTSGNYESGAAFKYANGEYTFTEQQGEHGSPGYDFNLPTGEKYDGYIHSHYSGLSQTFSYYDFEALAKMYYNGNINDVSSFMFGLVTENGIIFLRISDSNKFIALCQSIRNGSFLSMNKGYFAFEQQNLENLAMLLAMTPLDLSNTMPNGDYDRGLGLSAITVTKDANGDYSASEVKYNKTNGNVTEKKYNCK